MTIAAEILHVNDGNFASNRGWIIYMKYFVTFYHLQEVASDISGMSVYKLPVLGQAILEIFISLTSFSSNDERTMDNEWDPKHKTQIP